MEATVKIALESWRKSKKTGLSAVKLRVTNNRKPMYYSIIDYVKVNSWNYCQSSDELAKIMNHPRGRKSELNEAKRLNYEAIEQKASDIINSLPYFSFLLFEEKFLKRSTNWDYLYNAIDEQIKVLNEDEQMGYAQSFHSTLVAIKYYEENKPFPKGVQAKDHASFKKYLRLKFVDITSTWLKKFEKYLLDNEKSISTIGIYTRNIRRLFNLAIKEHNIKAEYPFDKYQPKTASNKKRALSLEQINAIAGYNAIDGTPEQFAKDIFIFSFLANGMNITDILRLKYKNINADQLKFTRFKTKNKKGTVEVNVSLTDNLRTIIKRHGNKAINNEVYIFPVLNGVKSELEAYRLIKQKNHVINNMLKKIGTEIGFSNELANDLSTYYARHSYATILKNSGESIEFIKESLGHTSSATTENYLSSFDMDHRKKTSDNLDKKIINL